MNTATSGVYHSGLVAPLDKNNVDTDQIIPKQFLTSVSRDGFDKALFYDWRYLASGQPNPDFVLNAPCYQAATVLLSRDNFGCGSSREHAPWALKQYGFSVIIAQSFADIFFNNAINNQMLLIALDKPELDGLFRACEKDDTFSIDVDLAKQCIIGSDGSRYPFTIAADIKQRLLDRLDFIGVTEAHSAAIAAHEQQLATQQPWLA